MSGPLGRIATAVAARLLNERTRCRLFRAQGARIGENTRLLVRTLGSEPYLVSIGDDTLVSSDVLFVTHDGGTWVLRDRMPGVNRFGRIDIGRRVFVGARSILLPGIEIGDGSVVAAGAVVTKDVPSGVVVAGVPAKVLCTVEEYASRLSGNETDTHGLSRDELRRRLSESMPHPW